MKYKIIIPARYKSTRFPGKPLIDLKGKSMIKRVWEKAVYATKYKDVYIATDSKIIFNHCKDFTDNIIITSDKCLTGTDRVAECLKKVDADYFINIQGDEPLINPNDIKKTVLASKKYKNFVINCMLKIKSRKEFLSEDIPKVVFDQNFNLLFMSRSTIPFNSFNKAYKQVCIYVFPRDTLKYYGVDKRKSKNELIENIEILRLIDNDIKVKMIELKNQSYAIDRKKDITKVLRLIKS
tara:strand:- start:648 stop:1361 length:714 start_codon:yes stop_codon:yes gene_type:complete